MTRNVAFLAHAPKLRAIPKVEQQAWTAQQLQAFLREAAGHRLFPALWLISTTGLRRSGLLGLQWKDVDLDTATLSINRGLVSVGYETHVSRGKTSNSRRAIDLDATTVRVLSAWRDWQRTEQAVVGVKPTSWVFTNAAGKPIHPHSISQTFKRIVKRVEVPRIRLHDLRHTHGTLLIKAGIPVKVVSERLGHGNPAFTIDTYQHVLPGMQAEAARMFESLIVPEASTACVKFRYPCDGFNSGTCVTLSGRGVDASGSAGRVRKGAVLFGRVVYRDVLGVGTATIEEFYGLPNARHPRLVIVIGQASHLPADRARVLEELNRSLHRVEIVPYDVLAKRADAWLKVLEDRYEPSLGSGSDH